MKSAELKSINPANGAILATFTPHASSEVEAAIAHAAQTFSSFRHSSFSERSAVLMKCAAILEEQAERWSRLMSQEMGKTRQAGMDEAVKCAKACRYYAEQGERFLAGEAVAGDGAQSRHIAFHPLGPILAIMPWNFPFWQVFRFVAPALMAGNTILLKHASSVPQCALAIEEILFKAGAAPGVFKTLLIGSGEVDRLVSDPRIRGVTLTGSEEAGAAVAASAGKNLKKVVLELGGSDPFIVMPSADLDHTVKMAIRSRTINSGQSCIAAKRFIIHQDIADEFERKFTQGMQNLRIGDPWDPQTEIGPLATPAILEGLAQQVERSVQAGAKILTGGKLIAGGGNYYEPTVLTNISPDSPAYHEEFFGPVAMLFRIKDLQEAIWLANDNPFGLGSSFWSTDSLEQEVFIREIDAGMAFVNTLVASDPALPFGGVKRSGFGRELSYYGIREFTNVKTVVIAT